MRYGIARAAVVAVVGLVCVGPASAQRGSFDEDAAWWIGYALNAPQQLIGVATALTTPRWGGWGLYLDGKLTYDSPARDDEFRADLTPDDARDFGDFQASEKSDWRNINGALLKVLGPALVVYAGGGVGFRKTYIQFADQTQERSETGIYWVEDASQEGVFPNIMGGAFFRLSRLFVFQIGAESAPAGVTAGMHVVLR